MSEALHNLRIDDIRIGTRHRKHLGDLEALAASISRGPLLQPVGVTPERELIWGYRRLLACRDLLGWETIPARIVQVSSIARGEVEENGLRKEYSPSERVAIIDSLRGYGHGGDRRSDQDRNCDVDRLTVEEAARIVGDSRDNYFRIKRVVSQAIPELIEAMDTGRLSVSAASELAGAEPDAQRRVLATLRDESGWAVRGVRKSLKRTLRRMAIERTEGRRVEAPGDGDIRLYHCPLQRLEEVAGIAPNSVHLILTDIPYGEDFLPQVSDLGNFANRVLIPGGLLVTYSGLLYLNRVIRSLDEHLTWAWAAASVWKGEASIIRSRNVLGKWKPILTYSKGQWQERGMWPDVLMVNSKEKDWHDWQQPSRRWRDSSAISASRVTS